MNARTRDAYGNRARVLVADDHPSLLDRVVSILDGEFSVVGTVSDGETLIAREAELEPDVLVVDVCMPGISGLEAAGLIRKRGSRAAVVCLTAHNTWDVIEAAWEAGAIAFVAKSAIASDLLPAVRSALEGRRFVSESISAAEHKHP